MKRTFILIGLILGTQLAFASDNEIRCHQSSDQQVSKAAIKQHFEAKGWEVRRIRNDHGCFEIYAIDSDGNRRESYIDPETMEIIRDDD
jgi:hypothetical protein